MAHGGQHTEQTDTAELHFGAFRLSGGPVRLWRGRREVKLQPRPLAVLRHLVDHAGAVVSRDELLRAVWRGTVVTSTALQMCVRAIRAALGDDAQTPRYIETVGREGYRFIGQVVSRQQSVVSGEEESQNAKVKTQKSKLENSSLVPSTQPPAPVLVGRETELTQLHHLFAKAMQGERQIIFITGEAGIGKTTLVDTFLSSSPNPKSQSPEPAPWIGRGQCIEHHGEGEPYLPVLEALGQLCQSPRSPLFLSALRRYAPTWLMHLPSLIEPDEHEALQRRGAGATPGQMLREMAEALEAISKEQPVIIVLEDLHMSDPSTVEIVAYLAQRRSTAQLLILGTYRPIDVVLTNHPIREHALTLVARGYAQNLPLEPLTETAVTSYLHQRLTSTTFPTTLAQQVHRRTDGNPLFMTSTVEYLLAQKRLIVAEGQWQISSDLTSDDIPHTLQQLLLAQFDRLPAEQRQVLDVASVIGTPFTTASVAAGLQAAEEIAETVCEALARGQFIERRGLARWPDGTISEQYGFRHGLYQEVLYQQHSAGRRARLHLAVGNREETGYGAHAGEHAAELARHFEEGHDVGRALPYLVQAGRNALARSAHVEAERLFTHGLTLLNAQVDPTAWRVHEMQLQMGLSTALMATKGFSAPEVEQALQRTQTLCRELGETPELLPVLNGLWTFAYTRGDLRTARTFAEQALRLAREVTAPPLLAVAQTSVLSTLFFQGEFTTARLHGEQTLLLFANTQFPLPESGYAVDLEVRIYNNIALVLAVLGYIDQAVQQCQIAWGRAQQIGHIQSMATTLLTLASLHGGRREWQEMQQYSDTLMTLATNQGLPFWWARAAINHGVAIAQQGHYAEGLNQIQQGLAVQRMIGAMLGITRVLTYLAEIYDQTGQLEQGLATIDEALQFAEQHDERFWEAELYRRKGELLLAQEVKSQKSKVKSQNLEPPSPQPLAPSSHAEAEAEACFHKAITIAQRQHAKWWELRAVMSLVRLRQQQATRSTQHEARSRLTEAHQMLSEVYGWFTEGFDTQDLQEAKTLSEKSGH